MKQSLAGLLSISALQQPLFVEAFEDASARVAGQSPADVAKDEDFWFYVQQAYTSSPNLINLNNGGVSPQPLVVQDAHERYLRQANEAPSYYMWQTIDQGREPLREKLAALAGCSPEELAIVRNTTEALGQVIFGLDLEPGDEIVLTRQDYPNMISDWKQREKRDKIVLKWVDLDLPIEDDDTFVSAFVDAFTPRTNAVQLTHLINWTGQVMPVAKIAREARKRNIRVIVDSAHAFAHLDYRIPDLECDYFGTSLHKWLSAPFGTGLLYVRQDRIEDLWPLFPNESFEDTDIRKLEWLGTRNMCAEMATSHALDFHNGIGTPRKEARLRYLKNYWAEQASELPGVRLHTSLKAPYSCALALFSVEGREPQEIVDFLHRDYGIHVIPIDWHNLKGVRVTPHVYTRLQDLDRLLDGIQAFIKA